MIITDIKAEFSPRTILALFIGHLVMEQKVPEEIIRMVDAMKEVDCPDGWRTFMSAWRNRSDDAVQDVYEILGQMIKDAVKTS
jgi:hypothetical protein